MRKEEISPMLRALTLAASIVLCTSGMVHAQAWQDVGQASAGFYGSSNGYNYGGSVNFGSPYGGPQGYFSVSNGAPPNNPGYGYGGIPQTNLALQSQGNLLGLPSTNLDSFVAGSGYNDMIYGDEGEEAQPPYYTFQYYDTIGSGMQAGYGGLTTGHPSDAPSAWGYPQ